MFHLLIQIIWRVEKINRYESKILFDLSNDKKIDAKLHKNSGSYNPTMEI